MELTGNSINYLSIFGELLHKMSDSKSPRSNGGEYSIFLLIYLKACVD